MLFVKTIYSRAVFRVGFTEFLKNLLFFAIFVDNLETLLYNVSKCADSKNILRERMTL